MKKQFLIFLLVGLFCIIVFRISSSFEIPTFAEDNNNPIKAQKGQIIKYSEKMDENMDVKDISKDLNALFTGPSEVNSYIISWKNSDGIDYYFRIPDNARTGPVIFFHKDKSSVVKEIIIDNTTLSSEVPQTPMVIFKTKDNRPYYQEGNLIEVTDAADKYIFDPKAFSQIKILSKSNGGELSADSLSSDKKSLFVKVKDGVSGGEYYLKNDNIIFGKLEIRIQQKFWIYFGAVILGTSLRTFLPFLLKKLKDKNTKFELQYTFPALVAVLLNAVLFTNNNIIAGNKVKLSGNLLLDFILITAFVYTGQDLFREAQKILEPTPQKPDPQQLPVQPNT